ncbi:MAG: acyl-ACP--UDP-N-acetylglucosamine O-acyltransferase [Deltaproteobacteria bacterium]|nr:acyl-ACP--UDP-N-acetylglucosamine O-acyltransferase [Deltaproteobacteria bacterium]MBI2181504.1 acyl-ACP--UDP-N-acetylglucosamine O-acyltransferase [Deltaproteobacteria bacterium]MBI2231830.1 acyl-ACP--UDP-N-acetylglucosamine O-acyltransferase [Deltaproteobacteria bacterium]MBI2533203.1 acyl-ACP--UDP-N-acetylglucosamine O-acyltransferase [Deltaproteobacteria bacterium]
MTIHPTAVIDPKAEIDGEVDIGPYVVIEGPVKIKRGTRVMAHAYLTGWTEIGADNEIHPGAVLGDAPQDKAYKGAETYLKIGERNIFREYVQVHRGTIPASSTIVGDDNFLMANSHVGHNCKLGNQIVIANGALLGGYVEVGNSVFISGNCVVHQFVRIGDYALMRGLSGTSRDVPPYAIVDWQHTVRGVNVVGLKRAGFDDRRVRELRAAFRALFRKGRNLSLAIKEIEERGRANDDVLALLEFIKSSKRGVCFGD